MKSVINHITHPEPAAIYQARLDHAKITKQEHVERPWWFENTENGYLYHDLFGCLAWPSEVSDRDRGMPGYVAIIGVVRPKDLGKDVHYAPRDAEFHVLCEAQSLDVPTLLNECLEMRQKYGYGIQPSLLDVFYGDPERYYQTVALFNERLGDRKELLFTPPDDFYTPKIFDNYVRSLGSTLIKRANGRKRLFFKKKGTDIIKTRINEFKRDDPAVLAVGGLVHSLLNRCMWMGQVDSETVFNVED